jgi:hypothetical protein
VYVAYFTHVLNVMYDINTETRLQRRLKFQWIRLDI